MRKGRVINSSRRRIFDYLPGRYADQYSALHPDFVQEHLTVSAEEEVHKSDLAAVYLAWVRERFDPRFIKPFTYDLHNLYLFLVECHGVDEDEPMFHGVGLRT